jgi:hypothetical protein
MPSIPEGVLRQHWGHKLRAREHLANAGKRIADRGDETNGSAGMDRTTPMRGLASNSLPFLVSRQVADAR